MYLIFIATKYLLSIKFMWKNLIYFAGILNELTQNYYKEANNEEFINETLNYEVISKSDVSIKINFKVIFLKTTCILFYLYINFIINILSRTYLIKACSSFKFLHN